MCTAVSEGDERNMSDLLTSLQTVRRAALESSFSLSALFSLLSGAINLSSSPPLPTCLSQQG